MSDKIIPFQPPENWRLFRVVLNIAPIASHSFSEVGDPMLLSMWLYGKSFEDAHYRAGAIAEQLPIELVGGEEAAFEANENLETDDAWRQHIAIAKACGISMQYAVILRKPVNYTGQTWTRPSQSELRRQVRTRYS